MIRAITAVRDLMFLGINYPSGSMLNSDGCLTTFTGP